MTKELSADEKEIATFETIATRDGEVQPKEDAAKPEAAGAIKEKPAVVSAAPGDVVVKPAKEAATAADESGEDDEDEAAKEPVKKRQNTPPEKRIAHYRRAAGDSDRLRTAAEQRAAAAEQRALAAEEALRGGAAPQKGLTPQKEAAKDDDKGRPSPDKYDYGELDSRYIADVVKFETNKAIAADRAAQETTRQQEAAAVEQRELKVAYDANIAAGVAKYEDFEEVVLEGNWPLSDTLGKLLLKSEVGADIAYHLASNPKEAQEVFGKSPTEQARYFGRLEAKFSSPSSSDAKADTTKQEQTESTPLVTAKTTKAPEPPANRARGQGGKTKVSPDTTDFAELEAAYEAGRL